VVTGMKLHIVKTKFIEWLNTRDYVGLIQTIPLTFQLLFCILLYSIHTSD
jgi:hypothetical protein